MDQNTLYRGGLALTVGAYGYGVYRLPKLEGHFRHEGLYVVGALVVGLFMALEGGGIWNNPPDTLSNRLLIGGGHSLMAGGLAYLVARNIKLDIKKSLIASAIVSAIAVWYNDKKLFTAFPVNKDNNAPTHIAV